MSTSIPEKWIHPYDAQYVYRKKGVKVTVRMTQRPSLTAGELAEAFHGGRDIADIATANGLSYLAVEAAVRTVARSGRKWP